MSTSTSNGESNEKVEQLIKKFTSKCADVREKLTQLKGKVNEDDLLKSKKLDDYFLLRFLNVRNFEPEATVELIRGYYTMRKDHPELFLLPSQVIEVFKDDVFTFIPDETSEGQRVLLFQPGNWNPQKYPATLIAAGPVPFLEVLCETHGEVELVEILDFKNVTWKQFTAMPVSLHKLSADLSERAIPVRYSKIHIVNQGKLVDMLWAIMKAFVSEEMKNKLIFHGSNYKNLNESIDSSLIPVHLGGKLNDVQLKQEQIDDFEAKVNTYWTKYPVDN